MGNPSQVIQLYEARGNIHPRQIAGRYQRLRLGVRWLLLGTFFLLPWLTWDGQPAVLFDLPARRFHMLGSVFFADDVVLAAGLLVIGAFALFTVTNLAGRVWCGYACPQSVWFSVFIWLEQVAEGDARAQQRLDKAPWTLPKFVRRSAKYALFVAFSVATAATIVAYFVPVGELLLQITSLTLGGWSAFWLLFFSIGTLGAGGFLREQVCFYMCPYARFQAAMFDKDTLLVSYDGQRGEPRGSLKASADSDKTFGDCVDCHLCVAVCPVGIDIRRGLQYECIQCALCIDACDSVMTRIERPQGLIRYATENSLAGKQTRWLRPRLFGYAAALLLALGALGWFTVTRGTLDFDVMRERQQLYRELIVGGEPWIENSYRLRLSNKSKQRQSYHLRTADTATALRWIGAADVVIDPYDTAEVAVRLGATRAVVPPGVSDLAFVVIDDHGEIITQHPQHFFAPEGSRG